MVIKIYQIDAFTDRLFRGNPAAVCPLNEWLPTDLMQQIAMENNLSETAFFVNNAGHFELRWFTPTVEVDLCGHATLASAHAIFQHEGYPGNKIVFSTRSGYLTVRKDGDCLVMDFPADRSERVDPPAGLAAGLGQKPAEAYKGKTDYMLIYPSQDEIEELKPDFAILTLVPARGIIVTAKGRDVDFVSRFFGPQSGVPEDPVTGSAHTTLTPYWAEKLGKAELTALQLSKRQGRLRCRLKDDRVEISGQAKTYLIGHIEVG